MDDTDVLNLALETMIVGAKLSAPILITSLIIGFAISLLQEPRSGVLVELLEYRGVPRAAIDPAVRGGEYYGPDGFMEQRGTPKRVDSNASAKDPAVAERLWHVSVELTGVPFTALDTPS